jgi:hypothetical protein
MVAPKVLLLVCALAVGCSGAALSLADGGPGPDARGEADVGVDVASAPDARRVSEAGATDVAEGDALYVYLVGFTAEGYSISIVDSDVHRLSQLPKLFTVWIAVPSDPPSVVWELDGKPLPPDNTPGFFMGEQPDGRPVPWNPGPGTFVVKATSYREKDGRGAVITSSTRTFTFLP